MVRYSKCQYMSVHVSARTSDPLLTIFDTVNVLVPFRHLVSLYSTHITHTPMILAAEFSRSAIGRRSDFSTSNWERGTFTVTENNSTRQRRIRGSLIAQFAANDPKILADACELIHPHVDGIDLNLGKPPFLSSNEFLTK